MVPFYDYANFLKKNPIGLGVNNQLTCYAAGERLGFLIQFAWSQVPSICTSGDGREKTTNSENCPYILENTHFIVLLFFFFS